MKQIYSKCHIFNQKCTRTSVHVIKHPIYDSPQSCQGGVEKGNSGQNEIMRQSGTGGVVA